MKTSTLVLVGLVGYFYYKHQQQVNAVANTTAAAAQQAIQQNFTTNDFIPSIGQTNPISATSGASQPAMASGGGGPSAYGAPY
jgi:hypothetical protein